MLFRSLDACTHSTETGGASIAGDGSSELRRPTKRNGETAAIPEALAQFLSRGERRGRGGANETSGGARGLAQRRNFDDHSKLGFRVIGEKPERERESSGERGATSRGQGRLKWPGLPSPRRVKEWARHGASLPPILYREEDD